MSDPINAWRQAGDIHLWRYRPEKRGLEGWHLTADKDGLNSVIALAELLLAATHPAKRTLRLTKPSQQAINTPFRALGGRKVIAPCSLQLAVHTNGAEDHWELNEEGDRAQLRLGRQSVVAVLDALRDLRDRKLDDFSIGPQCGEPSPNIWFWNWQIHSQRGVLP